MSDPFVTPIANSMPGLASMAGLGAVGGAGGMAGVLGVLNPISAGLEAVGGLFKGITGFFSSEAQARQEKLAAHMAAQQGGVNSDIALRQGDAVAEQGAANAAANGGGFVGSSLSVIQNLSDQAMYNARATAYRSRTVEEAHLEQASIDKSQAWSSLIGGATGAVGSVIGNAATSQFRSQMLASRAALTGMGQDPGYYPGPY
jgi:hypothetical protein